MTDQFFEKPVLNTPYDYPRRQWERDATGMPTQRIVESCRPAEFIAPIDRAKTGRIAVKLINHLGNDVMKFFRVR